MSTCWTPGELRAPLFLYEVVAKLIQLIYYIAKADERSQQ